MPDARLIDKYYLEENKVLITFYRFLLKIEKYEVILSQQYL